MFISFKFISFIITYYCLHLITIRLMTEMPDNYMAVTYYNYKLHYTEYAHYC